MNMINHHKPVVEYGRGLAGKLVKEPTRFLLVTMEDLQQKALALLDPNLKRQNPCYLVRSLEEEALKTDLAHLPDIQSVVGLGGGAAIDVAKYFAWQKNLPLFLIPSATSVDAVFTSAIALRKMGEVFYAGNVNPKLILVDYDLISSAPLHINRGGLGDLLSCHTALHDWQLAATAGYTPHWDKELAAQTESMLERLLTLAPAIRTVSEEAIFNLMEGYRWVAHMEGLHGHCRFEEGSEHFLAYNLEYITGKQFLHGPLVCLGVIIMSLLQNNQPYRAWSAVEQAGIDISLADLGLPFSAIEEALLSLASFTDKSRHPYSVINERPITASFLDTLYQFMKERKLL